MAGRVLLPAVSCRSARHLARSFKESGQNSGSLTSFDDDCTEPLLRRHSYGGELDFNTSVHYQSVWDPSEFSGSLRNRREVMRKRLRSHFMTPYQKYKHRGRKPWKLLLHFLKLLMVTVQVSLFSKVSATILYYHITFRAFGRVEIFSIKRYQ